MRILLLFLSLTHLTFAQEAKDFTAMPADSAIRFGPPSMTMVAYPNLEYVSASPVAPLSNVFIRSMDNPLITVDGIPQNISIFGTQPFREFTPFLQPLGWDIASIRPQSYVSDNTIVSGVNFNSLNLTTTDISGPGDSLQFFVNNVTSSLHQDSASRGHAVVNNAGVIVRKRTFASRLSLNHSVIDNYTREMGVRGYGVNAKILVRPVKNLQVTGYLDYSIHKDYKRTDHSTLDNSNSFSYVIAEYKGRQIYFQAKASKSHRSESLFRQIVEVDPYSTETFRQYVNYRSDGTYYEVNTKINVFRKSSIWSGDVLLGWKSWSIKEPNDVLDSTVRRNAIQSYRRTLIRPEFSDQKIYGTLRAKKGIISLMYLVDLSKMSGGAINANINKSDTVYVNHFGIIGVNAIRTAESWFQALNFGLRGGWINRTVVARYSSVPNGPSSWVNPVGGFNLEATIDFHAASSRLRGYVRTYYLNSDRYLSRQKTTEGLTLDYLGWVFNAGEVSRSGLETGLSAAVVNQRKVKWFLRGAVSWNKIGLKSVVPQWHNDQAANRIASLYSGWRVGAFDLNVIAAHKDGFEIFRDALGPTGAGPLIYLPLRDGYIENVDAIGRPTLKGPEKFDMVYTVNYTIIDNMRLTYTIDRFWRLSKMVIGVDFRRLRTLYQYMNDIIQYKALGRAQVPSFYNVWSASITLEF